MSFTATFFPIIAALCAPEGIYFGLHNLWSCVNEKQIYFIEHFFDKKKELYQFNDKELRSWVSKSYTYLNDIAKKNGFTLEFDPFEPNEFGSLSILDVTVQWPEEGNIAAISHNGIVYKAAQLKNNFSVFETEKYSYPIVKINTRTHDVVYITVADETAQEFALLQKITALQRYATDGQLTYYDHLYFPQVDLDQQVDISWLCGMHCPEKEGPERWIISQAIQQTKFKMDEKGAHVESAAGISFCKTSWRPFEELIIDQAFYVWIERPGCTMPVFAAYIDPRSWVRAN